LALVVLTCAVPARAWNGSGHRQIALLAFDSLSPGARSRLSAMLRRHPLFHEDFLAHLPADLPPAEQDRWLFSQAATWPDLARARPEHHRGVWHYVNLRLRLHAPGPGERAQLGLSSCAEGRASMEQRSPRSDASAPGPFDVEEAVARVRATLADAGAAPSERALALSWLLHLVADAHQPLHAVALFSDRRFPGGDRGGNEIEVVGRGRLHAVWDGLLGSEETPGAVDAAVQSLRRDPGSSALSRTARREVTVQTIIDESCELARTHVYTGPVLAAVVDVERRGAGERPAVTLDESRIALARRAARRRAVQAGTRLAAALEGALSTADRPAIRAPAP
jgi:hypothetical protein